MSFVNYYECLDVQENADFSTIRKAYHSKCLLHHPDKHISDGSRFIVISQAYKVLSDPIERGKFDASLRNWKLTLSSSCIASDSWDLDDFTFELDERSNPIVRNTCRCGQIISIPESLLVEKEFIECPSCSLIYQIEI